MEKELITLPDEQVGYLLSQTYQLKKKLTNKALKELDISYIQFVILVTALVLAKSIDDAFFSEVDCIYLCAVLQKLLSVNSIDFHD